MSIAISAVVPVKDEAGNVAPLAREIAAALKSENHEIIFVDDGSSDATAEELKALKRELPQLRVLRHARNLGQSRGIRSGVEAAKGGIIVTLDGDGQNDPADIPKLVAALKGRSRAGHGVQGAGQAAGHGKPQIRVQTGQWFSQLASE